MRHLHSIAFISLISTLGLSASEIHVEGLGEPLRSAVHSAHQMALEASKGDDHAHSSYSWGELGMLLQAHNLHEQAIIAYSIALSHSANPQWLYLRGISNTELGHTLEALSDYKSTIQVGLEVSTIWYRLGSAQLDEGALEDAKQSFTNALALEPDMASSLLGIAEIMVLEENFGEARQVLKRAREVAPEAGQIAYRLAQVERHLGNIEVSENLLKSVVNQHAPQIDDPMLELVAAYSLNPTFFVSAARRAYERGDTETAVESYRRALEIQPDSRENQLRFTNLLIQIEYWDELDRHIAELERKVPDSAELWYLKALGLFRRAQLEEALDAVDQSLELVRVQNALELRDSILQAIELAPSRP